jgi:hypothetical protein
MDGDVGLDRARGELHKGETAQGRLQVSESVAAFECCFQRA